MYPETLTKLTAIAKKDKAQFRCFWESSCMAHNKFHNWQMSAKWLLGDHFPQPSYQPLTAEEQAAEAELNDVLNAAYDEKDRAAVGDRQFRKVFGWFELTDLGDAILAKVKEAKVEPAKVQRADGTVEAVDTTVLK
jgi:hypothetical protein